MATIELRESDKRRAVNLNRKNKYGLDSVQMMRLINSHQKAILISVLWSSIV